MWGTMGVPHLILLLTVWLAVGVHAFHNVTVDDTDPSIVYTGHWGAAMSNSLDIGGGHTLTEHPDDKATFVFTGVAIYFYSPLWPYLVNTAISLDGAPSTLVDLQDHSQPVNNGDAVSESVRSAVVWGSSRLANTQHTLVMSVGAGQPYAVVDALMYTVLDSSDLSSSSSPTTTSSTLSSTFSSQFTSTTVHTSPSEPAASSRPTKLNVLPIALGAALGALVLVLIVVLLWFCCRKRKTSGTGPTTKLWTGEGPFPPQGQTIQNPSFPVAGLPMRGSMYSSGVYQHEQGHIPVQGGLDVRAREHAPFGSSPLTTMAGVGSGTAAHLYGEAGVGQYNPDGQSQWTGGAAVTAVRTANIQPQPMATQNHAFGEIGTPSLSSIAQSQATSSKPLISDNRALHLASPNSSMSYGSDPGMYYPGSVADSSEKMSSSMRSTSRPESSFTFPYPNRQSEYSDNNIPPADSLGKKREVGNDRYSGSTGQTSYSQHYYDQKDALRQIREDESSQAYPKSSEIGEYLYPSAGEFQSGSSSKNQGPSLAKVPVVDDAHPPAYTAN